MANYFIKVIVTAFLVVLISEVAKRNSFLAAMFASVPIISVMAILWLYADTHNTALISALSKNIFWLVLPSLSLFVTLPLLLDRGVNFYLSLALSISITIGCYYTTILVLRQFGLKI